MSTYFLDSSALVKLYHREVIEKSDSSWGQAPARFTHGNGSRTVPGILGPGAVNFDSLVAKNFHIAESRAQFRWETFNTFNTPEFGLPNQTLGGRGFGLVTGAGSRRIMQMGLKVYL